MDSADDNIYNPPSQFSRRAFIVGSLATGFALAVLPVSAETITTDANGLSVGEVKIPVKDGSIPGYRAMPDTGGPFPAILVVQEVFGVHEHIKDICRRLAKAGYFAAAPALYAREGDVAGMSDIKQIMQVVTKVPERQVASDLDATVAWAGSTGKADTSKLGITGFCCRAQSETQGWRLLVRGPTAAEKRYDAGQSDRSCESNQRADPRALRRRRSRYPDSADRRIARRAQGRGQALGDCRLSRYAPRLQRRLPSELSSAAGEGRLEANAGLVQATRSRMTTRRTSFAVDKV